jgi:hypothetical protein
MRIVSEEIAVPLKRFLIQLETGRPPVVTTLEHGPRLAAFEADQEQESVVGRLLDFADDTYSTLASGVVSMGLDHLHEEGLIGHKGGGLLKSMTIFNMLMTAIKFVATYDLLKADMTVDGNPAVLYESPENQRWSGPRSIYNSPDILRRTLTTTRGAKMQIGARIYIDGVHLTEQLERRRRGFASFGLELEPPKEGPLKGMQSDWSISPGYGAEDKVVIEPGSSRPITGDDGTTWFYVYGMAQPAELHPKDVMPMIRTNLITVETRVKDWEGAHLAVDAMNVALGLKEAWGAGGLKALAELAYRLK